MPDTVWVLSGDVRRRPSLLDRIEGRLSSKSNHSVVLGVYEDEAALVYFRDKVHRLNPSYLSFRHEERPVVRAGTP